jgi:hypothetical protein
MTVSPWAKVHFDTNHTLTLKIQALRKAGARGVAWWNTGSVDYAATDHQALAQARALLSFFTVVGCHRLSFRRDLHSNRAVIAVTFCQNDRVAADHHQADTMWDAMAALAGPRAPPPPLPFV